MSEPTPGTTRGSDVKYEWRWSRATQRDCLWLAAIVWIVLPGLFFVAQGFRDDNGTAASVQVRLVSAAGLVVVFGFLPVLPMFWSVRSIVADADGMRVKRGLGPSIVLKRSEILGVRPRRLVTIWGRRDGEGPGNAVRIARVGEGKRDIELPSNGMTTDEVRRGLIGLYGAVPTEPTPIERAVLERAAGSSGASRVFEAKCRPLRIWLPLTLLIGFVMMVMFRSAIEPVGAPLLAGPWLPRVFTWGMVVVICSVPMWPWFVERARGGAVRRLVVSDEGVELVRWRRTERWARGDIKGVVISAPKTGEEKRRVPVSIRLVSDAPRSRLFKVWRESEWWGEVDYEVEAGEMAGEFLRRFGPAIDHAGVQSNVKGD